MAKQLEKTVKELFKWTSISLVIGTGIGLLASFFLMSLALVTKIREANLWIILFLPFSGMLFMHLYLKYSRESLGGNNLVIRQGQGATGNVPWQMLPLTLFGTITTHLFGGSVGREGTAVQMGGALAEATGKLFRVSQKDRWLLIICGISGGFSAVFGTPVAGAIFSFEVLKRAKFKGTSFVVSLLTALIANQVATLAGATHSLYQLGEVPKTTLRVFGYVLVFSVIFGLVSRSFAFSVSFIKKLYQKLIVNEVLRIGFGACLVLLLAGCYGTSRYLGLSLPILSDAFQGSQPTFDFLNKFIFTVLSLGAGFQGGEVTPLFEIGASLGSLLGQLSQLPVGFVAGLGFVSVFAGATKTPVASFFMALELFGVSAAGWFLLGSFISVLASGKKGIYESQLRETS